MARMILRLLYTLGWTFIDFQYFSFGLDKIQATLKTQPGLCENMLCGTQLLVILLSK